MKTKKTTQLQIRLSEEKKQKWKKVAKGEGDTLSDFVEKSVDDRIVNLERR